MGSKIEDYFLGENLSILNNESIYDIELSFNGPADQQILQAWENRLNRLIALQEFFGKENYPNVKTEFLNCLTKQNHYCTAKVDFMACQYAWLRAGHQGSRSCACRAALIPAGRPCAAASSYPVVPLICPAKKRPLIALVSSEDLSARGSK